MPSFQLVGLPADSFTPLFTQSDDELAGLSARRVIATEKPGFPCRVSLMDAEVGEELLLLPFVHQPADSPYHASGPIYVRKAARQRALAISEIPDCVRLRLMSLRAYDQAHMMVDAAVCEGTAIEIAIEQAFENQAVDYIHLHNARPGCFSCRVVRA